MLLTVISALVALKVAGLSGGLLLLHVRGSGEKGSISDTADEKEATEVE